MRSLLTTVIVLTCATVARADLVEYVKKPDDSFA